jgi:LacI family transcriptional regulator
LLKSPVTLDDVARLAGVSPKTVSRVVNGEAHVRGDTKAAVEKAIATLGYRPNLAARSLAASRSFLIGLISMRLDAYIFSSMHSSGIRACRERGLHLMVEELETIDGDSLRYLENSLRQMRCDGVIVSQIADQLEILDLLERLKIRYVRIDPTIERERSDSVSSDIDQGRQLLAEHFWNLGHRRIAVASPERTWRNAMKDKLVALGCNPKDVQTLQIKWQKRPIEAGSELAAEVLAQRKRPTAVYAFNDEMAAGFISYAWAHGVNVPRDLSVAGFDDGDIARAIWPPITTVHQPYDEMVHAAVKLLAEPAEDGKSREVICPVQLIVRASTARPNVKI